MQSISPSRPCSQSIRQSITQGLHVAAVHYHSQYVSQYVSQSIYQSVSTSVSLACTLWPCSQNVSRSICQSVSTSVSQYVSQSRHARCGHAVSMSVSQFVSQSACQSVNTSVTPGLHSVTTTVILQQDGHQRDDMVVISQRQWTDTSRGKQTGSLRVGEQTARQELREKGRVL